MEEEQQKRNELERAIREEAERKARAHTRSGNRPGVFPLPRRCMPACGAAAVLFLLSCQVVSCALCINHHMPCCDAMSALLEARRASR